MRYGHRKNVLWDGTCRELFRAMRDDFTSIPGWVTHDDMTAAATPYIVFKVTTSEGAGNEFYLRMVHWGVDAYYTELWEGWNATTHVGSGEMSGRGRVEHNGGYNTAMSYYWCGDQDHILFYIYTTNPDGIHCPTYVGLTTKIQPQYDGPKGVIMVTWYYYDGHIAADTPGYSYSTYNKCPVLRGSDGVHDKVSKIYSTYPHFEGNNSDQAMDSGPYTGSVTGRPNRRAMWFSPLILVEGTSSATGIGPRGILKSVLVTGSTYYSSFGRTQKVRIGSRDYITIRWNENYSSTGVGQTNQWGYYGEPHSTHTKSWIMPTSDYYVPCFIEGV